MSAEGKGPDPVARGEELKAQLRELEAFVARTNAGGEPLPPAAQEMVERLREVVDALEGLTATLGDE